LQSSQPDKLVVVPEFCILASKKSRFLAIMI
jgi:hypothetical protein